MNVDEITKLKLEWQFMFDQNAKMREFCREILVHNGDDAIGNWDGCELEDLALKTGLLYKVHRTEPCNIGQEEFKSCVCMEYCYGDESWDCHRVVDFLLNGNEV